MNQEKSVAKQAIKSGQFAEQHLQHKKIAIIDEMLAARRACGLTQAQVAERMGTKAPSVARLESSLISGKHSPSIDTLRKYAAALGKQLEIHLV